MKVLDNVYKRVSLLSRLHMGELYVRNTLSPCYPELLSYYWLLSYHGFLIWLPRLHDALHRIYRIFITALSVHTIDDHVGKNGVLFLGKPKKFIRQGGGNLTRLLFTISLLSFTASHATYPGVLLAPKLDTMKIRFIDLEFQEDVIHLPVPMQQLQTIVRSSSRSLLVVNLVVSVKNFYKLL